MNKFDKEVNALFMSELGFEIGKNQRIFDQDTGLPLEVGGVKFVAPDCYGGKQSAEFDPSLLPKEGFFTRMKRRFRGEKS